MLPLPRIVAKTLSRRLDLWLPTYMATSAERLRARLKRRGTTTHVLFMVCDHFEPRHDATEPGQAEARVRRWGEGYAALRARCQAAFGEAPRHTWFYPPHHGPEHLPALAQFQYDGMGEVELHYHHDGDTSETLRRGLRETLDQYHAWGLLLQAGAPPHASFGFIHGDWALDNSRGGQFCGVDDELTILQEMGCWGDLTMPSNNDAQTRKINSIYYAIDDPAKPKSHDWGANARVGQPDPPGLFMLQGPLGINWRAPGYPRIENASLTTANWGRPDRVAEWLDANIHVRGRPEWLFVKLHTHGAMEHDFDALFGEKAFAMHQTLHDAYNDGRNYKLHYVTAREAYNIAKAAEHGLDGDPSAYRDFRLPRQATHFYLADAPHRLTACIAGRVALEPAQPERATRVRLRDLGVREVRGAFKALDVDETAGTLRLQGGAVSGTVEVVLAPGVAAGAITGARPLLAPPGPGGEQTISLAVGGEPVLVEYRSGARS